MIEFRTVATDVTGFVERLHAMAFEGDPFGDDPLSWSAAHDVTSAVLNAKPLGITERALWDHLWQSIEPLQIALADHPAVCDRIRDVTTRLLREGIQLASGTGVPIPGSNTTSGCASAL